MRLICIGGTLVSVAIATSAQPYKCDVIGLLSHINSINKIKSEGVFNGLSRLFNHTYIINAKVTVCADIPLRNHGTARPILLGFSASSLIKISLMFMQVIVKLLLEDTLI